MPNMPGVCVLAGGRGTRLGPLTDTVPKPLIEVAGKPFLFHQLEQLSAAGVSEVVLSVGYLGEMVESRVGDSYRSVSISYCYDDEYLHGTLGAIRKALPLLGERFLVLYGDTYLQVNFQDFASAWSRSELPAAMSVLENDGRWGTSNVEFESGRIVAYDKIAPRPTMKFIDYGLEGLSSAVVTDFNPGSTDLADLQRDLAQSGRLFGFPVAERFYEIGTPSALAETSRYLGGVGRGGEDAVI